MWFWVQNAPAQTKYPQVEEITVYGSTILLGAGGSTLLVTSLSMVADLIGSTVVRTCRSNLTVMHVPCSVFLCGGLIFAVFTMERIRENNVCKSLPRMCVHGAGVHLCCKNNTFIYHHKIYPLYSSTYVYTNIFLIPAVSAVAVIGS